jgi:formate dehydrogenase assembly factor FdhD
MNVNPHEEQARLDNANANARIGGSCGGVNDYRVVEAHARLDELLDAPEIDEEAIQDAMERLRVAIELRNITSAMKSNGGRIVRNP